MPENLHDSAVSIIRKAKESEVNSYTPRYVLDEEPDSRIDRWYEYFRLNPWAVPVVFVAGVILIAGVINLAYKIF